MTTVYLAGSPDGEHLRADVHPDGSVSLVSREKRSTETAETRTVDRYLMTVDGAVWNAVEAERQRVSGTP